MQGIYGPKRNKVGNNSDGETYKWSFDILIDDTRIFPSLPYKTLVLILTEKHH